MSADIIPGHGLAKENEKKKAPNVIMISTAKHVVLFTAHCRITENATQELSTRPQG